MSVETLEVNTTNYTLEVTNGTTQTLEVTEGVTLDLLLSEMGIQGPAGPAGKSISSVVKTSTVGLVDTYTITFNDSTTQTFTVTNGANGIDGIDGVNGADGRGIVSITRTSGSGAAGTTDTYTIAYTDSTTSTFTVYNGANGSGSVSSVGLSVPTGLTVSNSPITASGTLAVTYSAGYSIPTTVKQGQWDTTYGWGNHASAGYYASGGALGTPASGTLSNCTADGADAVGFRNIPQNSKNAAYTLVLTDAGKHILHPSADTAARIFTIPANASVAFPVGTAVTFINQHSGGVITINITTDTLRLVGTGATGSRSLAANGIATAIKLTAIEWIISGSGLT